MILYTCCMDRSNELVQEIKGNLYNWFISYNHLRNAINVWGCFWLRQINIICFHLSD